MARMNGTPSDEIRLVGEPEEAWAARGVLILPPHRAAAMSRITPQQPPMPAAPSASPPLFAHSTSNQATPDDHQHLWALTRWLAVRRPVRPC